MKKINIINKIFSLNKIEITHKNNNNFINMMIMIIRITIRMKINTIKINQNINKKIK